jgi:putative nucleotidyltransferase with HDIG domain
MAHSLPVVVDSSSSLDAIRTRLRDVFEPCFYGLDQIGAIGPEHHVLFDIDILKSPGIPEIKRWLARRRGGRKVVFTVDKTSWHARAQAAALGASGVCHKPLDARALMAILVGEFGSLTDGGSQPMLRSFPGVGPVLDALEKIFLSAYAGTPLDLKVVDFAGSALMQSIAETGVGAWIDVVRSHHSRTYQHCLLVTGIVVGFTRHLRLSTADQQRLAFAAMLHDIGKARVPIPILEKPSELDKDEMCVMRKHPEYGLEALASTIGVHDEVRDIVIHHHEFLDGTGYPHRLMGAEISDLNRIVTISDIFGALIERRAYKNAMSCSAAYDKLLAFGPKLDADLRREFQFVTELQVK